MNPRSLLPALVAASLLGAGAYAAVTLWSVTAPASVTVVSSPYETKLYTDESCLTPLTAVAFPEVQSKYEGGASSEWKTVVLRCEKPQATTIYIHASATGTPSGAVLEAQRWKYLSGSWENQVVGDSTFDGFFASDSPLVAGKPICTLRFRMTFPEGFTSGVYGFQIRFTVTDSATV